jgi:hypothetical protein
MLDHQPEDELSKPNLVDPNKVSFVSNVINPAIS